MRDKPGVLKVEAEEYDGENDIPFATIPKQVSVLMEADSSADQIMAVFDEFEDEVDDENVGSVEVRLDGPKRAVLATGAGIHATHEMAQDLVAAQADEIIVKYRREAYPVLPGLYLTLVPLELTEAVAFADRYRDAEEIDNVQLHSGGFILIRDEVNEDLNRTFARERFAQVANRHVPLTGAVIAARGSLDLFVAPADLEAMRQYLHEQAPMQQIGRVTVSANKKESP